MKQNLLYHLKHLIFLWSSLGLFFVFIFQNIITLSQKGLFFGHEYIWSDWPLHIAIANIVAYKDISSWFSYHPLYAQGKFTYPFLVDLISGLLIRFGFSLTTSFIVPSIIIIFILLTSLYFLFFTLLKSKSASIFTIFIFIFSSGLGFLNFASDFLKNPNLDNLIFPPLEYSKALAYEWGTGNVVAGMLLPQRAFLLGMTIGVLSLLFLILAINHKFPLNKKRSLLAIGGLLAGILPIAHPHSFIAVAVISGAFCFLNRSKFKILSFYFVPAIFISFFLYLVFISGGIQNKSFVTFFPGWTSSDFIDFFAMWWKLWGIMIPTAVVSFMLLFKSRDKNAFSFFSGFFILFILSNLFLFQPTTWDNSKLFFWSYLGFSGLAAHLIVKLSKKNIRFKVLMVFVFLSLTLTGMLEVIRISRIDKHTFLETSQEDIELGLVIRRATGPQDRFLTATTHNNLVMVWAARPIIMGYAGWVRNFGFEYQQTEKDMASMYEGGEISKRLIGKYKISYVFIGPAEKQNFNANVDYYKENFPVAFSNSENVIFDVRSVTSSF